MVNNVWDIWSTRSEATLTEVERSTTIKSSHTEVILLDEVGEIFYFKWE